MSPNKPQNEPQPTKPKDDKTPMQEWKKNPAQAPGSGTDEQHGKEQRSHNPKDQGTRK